MINLDNLCMGCMKEREGQTICPHCGYNDSQPQPVICLPRRTVLQDRYVVGKRLDSNGEGIGYLVSGGISALFPSDRPFARVILYDTDLRYF